MCYPCRKAGKVMPFDPGLAADYHNNCEFPLTCTCGHVSVSVLRNDQGSFRTAGASPLPRKGA